MVYLTIKLCVRLWLRVAGSGPFSRPDEPGCASDTPTYRRENGAGDQQCENAPQQRPSRRALVTERQSRPPRDHEEGGKGRIGSQREADQRKTAKRNAYETANGYDGRKEQGKPYRPRYVKLRLEVSLVREFDQVSRFEGIERRNDAGIAEINYEEHIDVGGADDQRGRSGRPLLRCGVAASVNPIDEPLTKRGRKHTADQ